MNMTVSPPPNAASRPDSATRASGRPRLGRLNALLRGALAGAIAGALLAAGEAAWGLAPPFPNKASVLWSNAGVGSGLGGIVGLLAAAAWQLARLAAPLYDWARPLPRPGAGSGADGNRNDDLHHPLPRAQCERSSTARRYALGLCVVAAATLSSNGLMFSLRQLERVKEEALHAILMWPLVAFWLGGTGLTVGYLLPLASRCFGAIERRWGLPTLRRPWLRFLALWCFPLAATAFPLVSKFGEKLGVIHDLIAALTFVVVLRGVYLTGAALRNNAPRRANHALLVLAALAVSASVAVTAWTPFPASASQAQGRFGSVAQQTLWKLTDVDRDGVSALFGGKDCAPWDGTRSPMTPERFDNGIDEDCDGRDATRSHGLQAPTPFAREAASAGKRYNVLWYVVDSLRPDHLSFYGYPQETSPVLASLATESLVFTNAYSQSSTTALSMPSMLTGRAPGSLTWMRGTFPALDTSQESIAHRLRVDGYHTALVINRWVQSKLPSLGRGFQRVMVAPKRASWASGDYASSNITRAIFEARQHHQPFFIVAHIDDVHHPYKAARGHAVPAFEGKNETLVNYDRGIARFDQTLAGVLAHLKNLHLYDNTVVIVTADHGEEFDEHGGTIHSRSCYDEVVHVPLVLHIPGVEAQQVNDRVALVDIVPTLLDLLGKRSDPPPLDGQSLLVPVEARQQLLPERPLFCSIFQILRGRPNFFTRSVRDGRFTFVEDAMAARHELYDVHNDPSEQHNLATRPEHAAEIQRFRGLLRSSLTGNLYTARSIQ